MKASPEQQRQLLRVQDADNRIGRVDHALKRLPQDAAIAELQAAIDGVRRSVAEVTGQLDDASTEIGRLQSDVAVVEQRIARDRDRIQATSSVKDIDALESELASLERRRSDLEDAELAVMERLEIAERSRDAVVAQQEEHERRLVALHAEREEEIARLQRERDDASADRMVVAQGVDQALLDLYERQRARYGIGAAALQYGVNLANNLRLGPSELAALRARPEDEVVIDDESGAILVRGDDSWV